MWNMGSTRPLRALDPLARATMLRTPTSILLGAEAPRALTIPMLAAVLADRRKLPAETICFGRCGIRLRSAFCVP